MAWKFWQNWFEEPDAMPETKLDEEQLKRLEAKVDDLIVALRLKEHLDRIEAKVDKAVAEKIEEAVLANDLKKAVDDFQSDVDAHREK